VTRAFAPRRLYTVPLPHGAILELGERPLVMGILNVTPDSFAEREASIDAGLLVDRALRMEADGADIVDVGGESTRPGADAVSAAEEIARVVPLVRRLAGRLRAPISVDTYKAEVARLALSEGASLVNDVSGLKYDADLAGVAAETGAGLVLMHTRGRPKTMYAQAHYQDLVGEIARELGESVRIARAAGVPADRLILDPGLGFAKRAADSYGVLAQLPALAEALERPILVGPSRKSFMSEALSGRPAVDRDWGTAAAVTAAVLAGAHIVRVHDVGAMAQVVRVAEQIRRA